MSRRTATATLVGASATEYRAEVEVISVIERTRTRGERRPETTSGEVLADRAVAAR